MRYLAIDHGIKRTGLAICDRSETIASPLLVIEGHNDQLLIKKITEIIREENVDAVVIGMPYNMDNSQGRQADIVNKFAELLQKQIDLPINFQDERLSSYAADEKLVAAEFTRKKKKKRLDAIAAAQILETFLEQKSK
ncbi:MAG: Holliday junction resolvase RuvX [Planctomycetota bacterium]|jgi:putative Holliday junction resolvase